MADLTITASNVAPGAGVTIENLTASAAITAGEAVYKNTSNGQAALAQADGTAAEGKAYGIAMNDAAAGQPVAVAKDGNVDLGATLTVGTTYVVSATAGGIAPIGDLTSGDYVSILGVASAADNLKLHIYNSEVEVA